MAAAAASSRCAAATISVLVWLSLCCLAASDGATGLLAAASARDDSDGDDHDPDGEQLINHNLLKKLRKTSLGNALQTRLDGGAGDDDEVDGFGVAGLADGALDDADDEAEFDRLTAMHRPPPTTSTSTAVATATMAATTTTTAAAVAAATRRQPRALVVGAGGVTRALGRDASAQYLDVRRR